MAKKLNDYSRALSFYDQAPKAVLAAIAVSALTCGGDSLEEASDRVAEEWWCLYEAGIVSQRPTVSRPAPAEEAS